MELIYMSPEELEALADGIDDDHPSPFFAPVVFHRSEIARAAGINLVGISATETA